MLKYRNDARYLDRQVGQSVDTVQVVCQGWANNVDTVQVVCQGWANSVDTVQVVCYGWANRVDTGCLPGLDQQCRHMV